MLGLQNGPLTPFYRCNVNIPVNNFCSQLYYDEINYDVRYGLKFKGQFICWEALFIQVIVENMFLSIL